MDGGTKSKAMTVDDVFNDFKGRRYGLIKALTTDLEELRKQCGDSDKKILFLYGFPHGRWEVKTPDEKVHFLGIKFPSDRMMQEKDWLRLIAGCCDTWLLTVSSIFGLKYGFEKADRLRLFHKMDALPTISKVVTGTPDQKGLCSICGENDMLLLHLQKCNMNNPGMADCFKCPYCSSSSSSN